MGDNRIGTIDSKAPLINVLIARPDGMPSEGVGPYFARRYNNTRFENWDELQKKTKRMLVDRERNLVLRYNKWQSLNDKVFGPAALAKIRDLKGSEEDGGGHDGKNYGGPAESEEHKKLKEWVANNPQKIGLRKSFGKGETEVRFLSGDSVDVLFADGTNFVTVEVKSCRSNNEDFRRGIYQCVKYQAVKIAEHAPHKVNVKTVLVTERDLRPDLKKRAWVLKVKHALVYVNKSKG